MNISLGDLASRLGLQFTGDATTDIRGIASLADAKSDQLAFLFNTKYLKHLADTDAAAVVLTAEAAAGLQELGIERPLIISTQPRLTWAYVAEIFDPKPLPSLRVHETAVVSPSASFGTDVTIGANAVIEAGARIDKGSVIGPGCFIGERVQIGENCQINANVSIYHDVEIGKQVIVHSGAVIGADGFGFEFDGASMSLKKIPQIYAVRIGDQVEIGAGTTIDRGALNHTRLGHGVKLDNQVQIGHGTEVGDHTVISGCTAIAGSTKVGKYCLIGGAVGIIDNLEIVDQVEITAMSLVSQSITEKGRYSSGTGLMSGKLWKRNIVVFSKLHEMLRRLRRLEQQSGS